MSNPIPQGWTARERTDLAFADWRFYRLLDPTFAESVSEANLVTRAGRAVAGPEAVADLLRDSGALTDPASAEAALLAERVGYLLIEPTSRSSGIVALDSASPPALRRSGDALTLEAGYLEDGAPWRATVTVREQGPATITRERPHSP